jgi:Flp pilus assembly protein TadG
MNAPDRRRRRALRTPRDLARDARGAVTIWMVAWSVAFLLLGGLAVDGANAWRTRAALQAVADATAQAAAVKLQESGEEVARAHAVAVASDLMPTSAYGSVLKSADVKIGAWDTVTGGIVANAAQPDAVRVTLRRADANKNPEPAYFLRLAGFTDWDVAASSTARIAPGDTTGTQPCWRHGLVARNVIDISSNNEFYNICLHAENYVNVQNNNIWGNPVAVSMPDLNLLQLPSSDIDSHNPGLRDALLEAENDPWIVDYVDEMIYSIRDNNSTIWIDNDLFDITSASPGVVYWVYCLGSGGVLQVPKDTVLEDMVVLTNCAIRFKKSVALVNTLMGTTGDYIEPGAEAAEAIDSSTEVIVDDTTLISGSNELVLGKPDGCTAGGGARLLIDGDFHNPAKLRVHGSQIIATGSVEVAAQVDAINGISVLAGHNIEVTSNSIFANCDQTDFPVPTSQVAVSMVE